MHERRRHLPLVVTGFVILTLLLGFAWLVPVYGMSPDPTPEPQLTVPSTDSPEKAGSDAVPSQGEANCAGIMGAVMNWGYQNEPGVTLVMNGDTYYLSQISTSDGQYSFRGLGKGYAVLSPALTGAQGGLHVYTDKVAVPLQCEHPVVLNLGIYSGQTDPQPPAYLTVTTADTQANPGDTVQFNIAARNDLPTAISHVVITDLFPTPLKISHVETSRGEATIADKRMLSVYVGDMESGETVTATISAKIDRWTLRGEKLENRVTLLYAESMADQVVSTITIGKGIAIRPSATTGDPVSLALAAGAPAGSIPEASPAEVPVSASALGEAGSQTDELPAPITIFAIGDTEKRQVSPSGATVSAAAMDTAPIGERLPVTGFAFDLVTLSLIAVGLLGIAVIAQFVRGHTS